MNFKKKLPPLKRLETLTVLGDPGPSEGSSGLKDKPVSCGSCKFCNVGVGFLTYEPRFDTQIGFMFSAPSKEDVLYNKPYSGGTGWVRRKFTADRAKRKGITYEAFYATLCMPPTWSMLPGKSHGAHPAAIVTCGDLYGGLKKFKPDIVMITYEPLDTTGVGAYTRQLEKDVDKALKFCEDGYRVLIGLGDKAAMHLAPFIKGTGGLPAWHGHWWLYE